MPEPTTANTLKEESFQPITEDWKWKPGEAFRIQTPVSADTYTLIAVSPVKYAEFQKLLDNIFVEKRQALAKEWFAELAKRNLVDVSDWKEAAEKAKRNGQ